MIDRRASGACVAVVVAMLAVVMPVHPSPTLSTTAGDTTATVSGAPAAPATAPAMPPASSEVLAATNVRRHAPGATAPTAQVEGLEATSTTRYRLEPANARVQVTHTVELVNTMPPRSVPGGQEFFYFDRFAVFSLGQVSDLSVSRVDGGSLTASVEDAGNDGHVIDIDLSPNLTFGAPQTLTVTYSLATQPNGTNTSVRVNDAYATWYAVGSGSEDNSTIVIDVPERFETEIAAERGDPPTTEEGRRRYRFTDLALDDSLFGISATDRDRLVEREVEIGNDTFSIRAWPGDDDWATFAEETVTDGVPALADYLDLELGDDEEFVIAETATPGIFGYGGWFANDTVEISDAIDPLLMLHELSHLWLNDDLFDSRWVTEGLAELASNHVADQLGTERSPPEAPDASAPGAQPLSRWGTTNLLDTDGESERYGYGAAYWVIAEVAKVLGGDGLRRVLGRADANEIPLQAGTRDVGLTVDGWRYFYDLVSIELDGKRQKRERIDQLFRNHVLADNQSGLLQRRREAMTAYRQFVDDTAGWAAPRTVRRELAAWAFDPAREVMGVARGVVEAGEAFRTDAPGGLDLPPGIVDAYNQATSKRRLDDVTESIEEARAVAPRLADALDRTGGWNPIDRLGLLGSDATGLVDDARAAFEAGDIDDAADALNDAQGRLDDTTVVALLRLLAVLAVLAVAAAWVGVWKGRRRRSA